MAKLSYAQLASLALGAGVPKANAATAVAIAMAESRGDTNAYNPRGKDLSYGLWQINMRGDMGPDRRSKLGIQSNSALFDPEVNARAMFMISGGGKSWNDWTTYTRGTFLVYMADARAAVGDAGTGPVTVPAGATDTSGLATISKAFATITNVGEWKRIGLFLAGWFLLVFALVRMTGTEKLVGKAIKTAVPIGKVAKVAKMVKK